MCGIVGYTGYRESQAILLEGLQRLEYRGYDSAGIAVFDSAGKLQLRRCEGKLARLSELLSQNSLGGNVGIGHTRWATHGKPSESNAHPHRWGRIALVHNGIIENYSSLRVELLERGDVFESETDTEIVAHLIGHAVDDGMNLLEAVRFSMLKVRGSYAILAMSEDNPNEIVLARYQSPLIVALGEGEYFAVSDVAAVLRWSRDVIFLEDGDFGVISSGGVMICDSEGCEAKREVKRIQWDVQSAERRGYSHYMLKEINEQPEKIVDTLRGRLLMEQLDINMDIDVESSGIKDAERIQIVACGTSYHAGLLGRHYIERLAGIAVEVDFGSEYRYREPLLKKGDYVLGISQSGETADTLASLQMAKSKGVGVISICNVMESSIARLSEACFYTRADLEIGVCSTKAFTTQLASLLMLGFWLGRRRGALGDAEAKVILESLRAVPQQMEKMLLKQEEIREVAQKLLRSSSFLYLGRGVHYPIAMEGALKMKEISYIHAEAYASGEMKHGPIALIDEKLPVIVIAPKNSSYEKTLSNMQEVRARGGRLYGVVSEGDEEMRALCEECFEMPDTHSFVQPLLSIVPLQLLAYHLSDLLGNDVDQPRNLAKSVTVE